MNGKVSAGLHLREVEPRDIELLYRWANDATVRQNAFHTESIPYDDHKRWFVKNMADRDVLMYVLYQQDKNGEEEAAGQIRFSIEADTALIDYSIAASQRGKGFGAKLILMAEEELKNKRACVIYSKAQVKYENIPSRRVFEKCGYDACEQEKYIEFLKRIRS